MDDVRARTHRKNLGRRGLLLAGPDARTIALEPGRRQLGMRPPAPLPRADPLTDPHPGVTNRLRQLIGHADPGLQPTSSPASSSGPTPPPLPQILSSSSAPRRPSLKTDSVRPRVAPHPRRHTPLYGTRHPRLRNRKRPPAGDRPNPRPSTSAKGCYPRPGDRRAHPLPRQGQPHLCRLPSSTALSPARRHPPSPARTANPVGELTTVGQIPPCGPFPEGRVQPRPRLHPPRSALEHHEAQHLATHLRAAAPPSQSPLPFRLGRIASATLELASDSQTQSQE